VQRIDFLCLDLLGRGYGLYHEFEHGLVFVG
jgi:hypothetical protein